ncbi:uncharacterized protein B0T23DRAFT_402301 [Neurospora hispaniola]|uniref:Uncharacterized protein n=1 Tax=Neurospora hispaniola TaxID=588809 RepID=A0AAJ0ICR6_9PEZI|nr:hypothetical protein B0T23DRAFT_402301 [Neurospora hispaniola]
MMICPSPVCFLPVPSMWHSTTAHRPICQHNQKVHRQTEEEEGITYPIHAREEGPFTRRCRASSFDYILRLPLVITAIGTSRTVTAESTIRLDQP